MKDLPVAKYQGTGNDFVMLLDLEGERPIDARLAAALCDRRTGVGADGVIRVTRDPDGADLFMDYRNADGSLAEMCGNGIRCLAAFALDQGVTLARELTVGTRSGVKRLSLDVDGGRVRSVTVGMGAPRFLRGEIPMVGPADQPFLDSGFEHDGVTYRASAVSMGNPHLVVFMEQDEHVDVARVGSAIERDERFPEGVNVEFVHRREGVLDTQVWERGSGETMACGTGACAVAVAAHRAGLSGDIATVRFPGGDLKVEVRDDEVMLTGPAERSFDAVVPAGWFVDRGIA